MITDEIYEHLTYDGAQHVSMPVVVPELADTCIVLNGVAKTYAMTGWRVGWMIGPTDVIKAATNLQSHLTSNVDNVAQVAATVAVSGSLDAVEMMRSAFDRRRRTMVDLLSAIPGVACPVPQGAFYAYPSVADLVGKDFGGVRPALVRAHSPPWRWSGPRWQWCPVRRSARRATSGCPTRWVTRTWSPG